MRHAIRFVLYYFGLAFLLIVGLKMFFNVWSLEVSANLFWLYVIYLVVSVVMFLLFGLLEDHGRKISRTRIIWYILLCLFVLNVIPYFEEGKFITLEVVKSFFGYVQYDSINLWIHAISTVSFTVSYLLSPNKRSRMISLRVK
jgi:hypothetical protein